MKKRLAGGDWRPRRSFRNAEGKKPYPGNAQVAVQ